jgi:hypothetical protein
MVLNTAGFVAVLTLLIGALIYHRVLYRHVIRDELTFGEPGFTRLICVSALLAALYAWQVVSLNLDMHRWPHVGHINILPILIFGCGLAYQAMFIAIVVLHRRMPRYRWLVLVRLLAIVSAIAIWPRVMAAVGRTAIVEFSKGHEPMITAVREGHLACDADTVYFPPSNAFDRKSRALERGARLYQREGRFVITYVGGSIDIDGSTIYYDSKRNGWDIHHNDDVEAQTALELITGLMRTCQVTHIQNPTEMLE